jgi:hypothetical protein
MNKQRIVAGLASVAMASTLVACSGGSSSNAKTLTVSVNQSLTGQFTPQYASSAYDQYVVNLCYESMLKYNADNELEPVLAKDLPEVSEDGLTLTYKLEKGYSLGWLHHKGRNKHHWEYWLDFGVNGIYACKMPTNYVIEMFCDRVAASMIYQKEKYTDSSALEYYENGRGKILIHPETDALIHHLLKYLSEHGLDQTIHYIVTEIKE